MFPAESREESAVALPPPSDCSLGICTFNWGRFGGSDPLLVREGFGTDSDLGTSVAALTGIDCKPGEPCGRPSTLRGWLL